MKTLPSQLPAGWFISPPIRAAEFHDELQRELPDGHLLHKVPLEVVAHREGTDDILCQHQACPNRFSVVHLSWIGKAEGDALHPTVEFDGSFEAFLDYEAQFYQK